MTLLTHASLKNSAGIDLPLEGIRASGDIKGLLLDMHLTQHFFNSADCHSEIIYTFPIPWGAVLLNVDVLLGDEKFFGKVIEKVDAEAAYEEALSSGDSAIMLERNGDHSYSLNLGNIAPKERCVVHIQYAQTLRFEQRGLRLIIPTVIAPRYEITRNSPPVSKGNIFSFFGHKKSSKKNSTPHLSIQHDLLVEYPFEIEMRIHGDLTKARIASPSHPIALAHTEQMVTLSLSRQGALDRDFILVLDQLQQDSLAIVAEDFVQTGHQVVMASFCPRIKQEGTPTIDLNLLVDCSGSMVGDSISSSKRALQFIVTQLQVGDRFSLSRFGSHVEHRSRAMWKATETSKRAAQRWVNELSADMDGTEMERALCSTFELAKNISTSILMITDGEINEVEGVISAAKISGHRIFIVGIGSAPAEAHLRRLAEATGGACDFVAPGESVEPAVIRMFVRMRTSRMFDISLEWPEGCLPIWSSRLSGSIFDGDTVNVYALLSHRNSGQLRLIGKNSATSIAEDIASVTIDAKLETGDMLSRMAAYSRIMDECANNLMHEETKKISIDYQLITESTNFILIRERSDMDKAPDMPNLLKIKQMMPAGFSGYGSNDSFDPVIKTRTFSRESGRTINCIDGGVSNIESDNKEVLDMILLTIVLDRSNTQLWSRGNAELSLMPIGLMIFLKVTSMEDWPETYDELKNIGVSRAVVDWLELMIASEGDRNDEEFEVVRSFLSYFYQLDITNLKFSTRPFYEALDLTPEEGLKDNKSVNDIGASVSVVTKITENMTELTPEKWPDVIFEIN